MQRCLLLGELELRGLLPLGSSASAFSSWFVSCVSMSTVLEELFPVGSSVLVVMLVSMEAL